MPRKDDTVEVLDETTEAQGDFDLDGDPNLSADDSYDGTGELRLDISEQELTSEARVYTPVPPGAYIVCVTEGEVGKVRKTGPNFGKPFWKLKLAIQEQPGVTPPEYVGRILYTNIMLFKGSLYNWAQLAKALGMNPDVVPPMSRVVGTGEKIGAVVARVVDTYKIEQGEWNGPEDGPKPMKNEVKGFMPAGRVGTKLQTQMPNHGGRVMAKKGADSDLAE
jgi:hypothetical protein